MSRESNILLSLGGPFFLGQNCCGPQPKIMGQRKPTQTSFRNRLAMRVKTGEALGTWDAANKATSGLHYSAEAKGVMY